MRRRVWPFRWPLHQRCVGVSALTHLNPLWGGDGQAVCYLAPHRGERHFVSFFTKPGPIGPFILKGPLRPHNPILAPSGPGPTPDLPND